jgi:hypothetical protein
MKPNQQLKYQNDRSLLPPNQKLTTVDENNEDMKLDKIYPEHFGALNKVDLLKNFEAPTLGAEAAALEAASKDEVEQATKKRRERDRK